VGATTALATETATIVEDHLACSDRADSVRFMHFEKSDAFPEMVLSERSEDVVR
jgi:hypothetical protein